MKNWKLILWGVLPLPLGYLLNFAMWNLPLSGPLLTGTNLLLLLLWGYLAYRLSSPRIAVATEPYPNRWTHHVVISEAGQIDEELLGWLREAYDFAMAK